MTNDTVAVAMHFAMKNDQTCFSQNLAAETSYKFVCDSKIASDCGCDAAVHSVLVVLKAPCPPFACLTKYRTNRQP